MLFVYCMINLLYNGIIINFDVFFFKIFMIIYFDVRVLFSNMVSENRIKIVFYRCLFGYLKFNLELRLGTYRDIFVFFYYSIRVVRVG